MRREDAHRVRHMLEYARRALAFVDGRTRADLDNDEILTLALVRCLEIVGEAAANIPSDVRDAYPDIPWRIIVTMRNRLVHAYWDINLGVVWQTVDEDLPALIPLLERLPRADELPD